MTDQDLLTELQYALLEPPDGGASWPSEVWTRDQILDAVNDALRSLVRSTHLSALRTEIAVLAGATSVALPADWLATAGVVWRTVASVRVPLDPADSFEADTALPGWETATGQPLAYDDLGSTTLTLRLIPTPDANGTVELLYVPRPAAVNGSKAALPIADEFAASLKYGALALVLRTPGRLQDPERATYCDQRTDVTEIATRLLLTGWA